MEEIAKGEAGLEAYRKQLDEAKKGAQGKLKELEGQLAYIMSLEPGPEDEDYEELHQKWEEQYGASIEQLETGDVYKRQVPGVKNMLFGGEGVFNTIITGPGHVWLQTMPISNVAGVLRPYMPSGS